MPWLNVKANSWPHSSSFCAGCFWLCNPSQLQPGNTLNKRDWCVKLWFVPAISNVVVRNCLAGDEMPPLDQFQEYEPNLQRWASQGKRKFAFWHFFTCMFVSTLPFSLGVFKDKEERQRWICVKMIIIIIYAHWIIFYFISIFVITVCFSTCCFLFYRDLQSKQHRATFQLKILLLLGQTALTKSEVSFHQRKVCQVVNMSLLQSPYKSLLHIYLNLMENQQNHSNSSVNHILTGVMLLVCNSCLLLYVSAADHCSCSTMKVWLTVSSQKVMLTYVCDMKPGEHWGGL